MTNFHTVLDEAFSAGRSALVGCTPTPVGFCQADLAGNKIGPTTIEADGNCGGACIRGIQYNTELFKWFAKNAKKDGDGFNATFRLESGIVLRKDVYKGYTLHFPTNQFYHGQSHERYKAFYDACVAVLKENGVICYVYDYLT